MTVAWDSEAYTRARFHYLLQIIYGESLATDYCRAMSEFAPSEEARDALLRQQEEEGRHLELLTDTVARMPRPPAKISPQMTKLHALMAPALARKDWAACILVQNFIVEGLALTLCGEEGKYGDTAVHDVFATIAKDEVRHVAFGVEELKKVLAADTDGSVRRRLVRLQRKALLHSILLFKTLAPEAGALGMRWDALAEKVVEDHQARIRQAGFALPLGDRLFLKAATTFFKLA